MEEVLLQGGSLLTDEDFEVQYRNVTSKYPLRDCICNNVERGDSCKQPKSEGLSPKDSPRKQPTIGDATTVFPAK